MGVSVESNQTCRLLHQSPSQGVCASRCANRDLGLHAGRDRLVSGPVDMQNLAKWRRLDGLNKDMRDWDVAHYGRIFNAACRNADMPIIQYPDGMLHRNLRA